MLDDGGWKLVAGVRDRLHPGKLSSLAAQATVAVTMPFDEMTEVSGSGWAELDGPGDGTVKTLGVKAPWLGRRRVDPIFNKRKTRLYAPERK